MKAIACGILLCTAALLVPTTPASSLEVNQGSVPTQGSISDSVTTALLSRGLTFEELPAKFDLGAVPAAHAKTLRVQQVSWDVVRRLIQIRLGCESAGQCMPWRRMRACLDLQAAVYFFGSDLPPNGVDGTLGLALSAGFDAL